MSRPKVLISDDEPLVVSALTREARRAGLESICDTTSERTLDLAREHQPAVIILDLAQRVDGRDILQKLKRDPATAHLKVIILSAIGDQYTRQTCLELGALDYELKPFDIRFMAKVARMAGLEERLPQPQDLPLA
jgi:two-component system, OmpR family, response regulator AdeR